MSERLIWQDGRFIHWNDATVHVLSHVVQRGTLCFDFLSIHDTERGPGLFRLPEHLRRLENSCALTGLPLQWSVDQLITAVIDTVRANPGAKYVKVSVLIPSVEVDVLPQDFRSSVYIAAYEPGADIVARNQGAFHKPDLLRIKLDRSERIPHHDLISPQAKTAANYTATMTLKGKARSAGFDEVLLLDPEGNVAEAPTSNFFMVDDEDCLRTPPLEHILAGITRDSILNIAPDLGIRTAEMPIPPADLAQAREAFLSTTSKHCWPIIQIDEQMIGDGGAGPVAEAINQALAEIVNGRSERFDHWMTYVETH